jgi:hypothetical protein
MFWVIRWVENGEDKSVVIEAASRAGAECSALKRNIPVVFVGEADAEDIHNARRAKTLWKYTPESRRRCFGRPVSGLQLACFMFLGVVTAGVHVQRALCHCVPTIPLRFW